MRDSLLHQITLQIHLGAGVVALLTFWVQVFRRKGGAWHRRVGWTYATAMGLVVLTAVPLTVAFWQDGQELVAMFLGFLGVITLSAGVEAIMASRNRTSDAWTRGPWMIGATVLISAYSVLLLVLFARTGAWLFLVMGGIGLWAGIDYVRTYRNPPPYRWVARHLGARGETLVRLSAGICAVWWWRLDAGDAMPSLRRDGSARRRKPPRPLGLAGVVRLLRCARSTMSAASPSRTTPRMQTHGDQTQPRGSFTTGS